jgi:hypothetical protein
MSDTQDDKLEALLRSRPLEPASPELAERIVLKAQSLLQNPTLALRQWIARVFAEYHLPQPVYVLTGTLILGLVVGFTMPVAQTTENDPEPLQVQSFLYPDEAVL